jgi:ATP-binding protein involved in chromosome partitioning
MPLKMFQKKEPPNRPKASHVVAIAAGKGGVGKSSVTVNLAIALKRAGYAVGVLDTDIYGPSIRRMLPEEQMPRQNGEIIIPAICRGGIRMISMAYFRKENEAAAVRAPIANGVITQFLKNVDWGHLDFLLLDFPPGTGDIQLTLSQHANLSGAVVVTTPQEVALMDVRKAVNLFEQVQIPIIGVIENMSYYKHPTTNETIYLFGKGGGERLSSEIGAPFLGQIPIDPEICRCGDEGGSLFDNQAEPTPAAKALNAIAQSFVAHVTTLDRLSKECLTAFELEWEEMI